MDVERCLDWGFPYQTYSFSLSRSNEEGTEIDYESPANYMSVDIDGGILPSPSFVLFFSLNEVLAYLEGVEDNGDGTWEVYFMVGDVGDYDIKFSSDDPYIILPDDLGFSVYPRMFCSTSVLIWFGFSFVISITKLISLAAMGPKHCDIFQADQQCDPRYDIQT